jgi:hypothetical protein
MEKMNIYSTYCLFCQSILWWGSYWLDGDHTRSRYIINIILLTGIICYRSVTLQNVLSNKTWPWANTWYETFLAEAIMVLESL